MSAPRTVGIGQFARENGLVSPADLSGVIHGGLMGTPEGGQARARYRSAIERAAEGVDATRRLYAEAVERGEIAPPARRTASEIAAGHPDLPATQAARRVLAKHAALRCKADATGGSA